MTTPTLTVSELLDMVDTAVTVAVPGPVWVRGEVSGLRRTSGGACFFRLVDPTRDGQVIDVAARGRVMLDVDRVLGAAGVGALRHGVEVRLQATAGIDRTRSVIRLSLLEVDPEFISGRLAAGRDEVLRRLAADGSLVANGRHPLPLVPLRVGLVTSRGSAAHADFLDQLRRSGYRFAVRTVHAAMQGEGSIGAIVGALHRLADEEVDIVVVVRGGGAKLDLVAFDAEEVGSAVAGLAVPVLTGIGHEIDRSVMDEAAAVAEKTPTAAGEWLVQRVGEFAARIDRARQAVHEETVAACRRAGSRLDHSAALLGGVRGTLARQHDQLRHVETGIAERARHGLVRHRELLDSVAGVLTALGLEATLNRGFALVTDHGGGVVKSAASVSPGDHLAVRFADGTVGVKVEER